jgi:hypothetical protein
MVLLGTWQYKPILCYDSCRYNNNYNGSARPRSMDATWPVVARLQFRYIIAARLLHVQLRQPALSSPARQPPTVKAAPPLSSRTASLPSPPEPFYRRRRRPSLTHPNCAFDSWAPPPPP